MKDHFKKCLLAAVFFGFACSATAYACVQDGVSCICIPGVGCFNPGDSINRP